MLGEVLYISDYSFHIMFTHLAWCWWAADPVRPMYVPRDEIESLRRWRLSDDVWDYVEPRIRLSVEQLIKHVKTPEFSRKHLRILANKLGKEIHTYFVRYSATVIRPTYTYVPYRRFEDTLRT